MRRKIYINIEHIMKNANGEVYLPDVLKAIEAQMGKAIATVFAGKVKASTWLTTQMIHQYIFESIPPITQNVSPFAPKVNRFYRCNLDGVKTETGFGKLPNTALSHVFNKNEMLKFIEDNIPSDTYNRESTFGFRYAVINSKQTEFILKEAINA